MVSSTPLAGLGEPEEDPATDLAVDLVELVEDVVGPVLESSLKLAQRFVGRDGEPSPFALLPEFHQCELEQRERPGLTSDGSEQHLDQPRLELAAGQQGGPLDGATKFILGHRADQELVVRHRRGQRGVRSALAVEIGPHRQHHDRLALRDRRRIEQVVEEGLSCRLVLAEREDLLGLVHQHDQPGRQGSLAEGQACGQVQGVLGGAQGGHQPLYRDRRGACHRGRPRRRPGSRSGRGLA